MEPGNCLMRRQHQTSIYKLLHEGMIFMPLRAEKRLELEALHAVGGFDSSRQGSHLVSSFPWSWCVIQTWLCCGKQLWACKQWFTLTEAEAIPEEQSWDYEPPDTKFLLDCHTWQALELYQTPLKCHPKQSLSRYELHQLQKGSPNTPKSFCRPLPVRCLRGAGEMCCYLVRTFSSPWLATFQKHREKKETQGCCWPLWARQISAVLGRTVERKWGASQISCPVFSIPCYVPCSMS